jgi:O-antigen ligase
MTIEFRSPAVTQPAASSGALFMLAAAAAIAVACIVTAGEYQLIFYVLVLAMPIALAPAILYASRHPETLPFTVGLLYLILPVSLLSEELRGVMHYVCLALFALPHLPRLLKSNLLWEGDFRLCCIYFLWASIMVVQSLAPIYSIGRLIGAGLGFIAIAACIMTIKTAEGAWRLLYQFFIACAIMTGVTIVSNFFLPHAVAWQTPFDGLDADYISQLRNQGVTLGGIDRFRGLLGNPNDVGALMLATIATALSCWKGAKRRQKWLMALVCLAIGGASVRADSRSAIVAVLVGCALYACWRYRFRGFLVVSGLAGAMAIVWTALHGFGEYGTRGLDTLTGRTDIWVYALQRIRERPITGYGYEVSGAIFANRYFPLWYGPWDSGPHSSLHNGYIEHMVGVGVPATGLWLYIILRPWWFLFRRKEDPWNLKAVFFFAVVPALIYNFTEAALGDFIGLIGFFFFLAWGLGERYRLVMAAADKEAEAELVRAMPAAAQALLWRPLRS